jgi:hypothetical protein
MRLQPGFHVDIAARETTGIFCHPALLGAPFAFILTSEAATDALAVAHMGITVKRLVANFAVLMNRSHGASFAPSFAPNSEVGLANERHARLKSQLKVFKERKNNKNQIQLVRISLV